MKPLLKITFKEPLSIYQDGELQKLLFVVADDVTTSKKVSNILVDYNVISLSLIKSIEFIQPTDLK